MNDHKTIIRCSTSYAQKCLAYMEDNFEKEDKKDFRLGLLQIIFQTNMYTTRSQTPSFSCVEQTQKPPYTLMMLSESLLKNLLMIAQKF